MNPHYHLRDLQIASTQLSQVLDLTHTLFALYSFSGLLYYQVSSKPIHYYSPCSTILFTFNCSETPVTFNLSDHLIYVARRLHLHQCFQILAPNRYHYLFLCLLTKPHQYFLIAALFIESRYLHFKLVLSVLRGIHLATVKFNRYFILGWLLNFHYFILNLFEYDQRFEFHHH